MAAPTRNLLILHTEIGQALSDWEEVQRGIEARAPDIEVRIADNAARNSVTRRWQVSRPSLVFSPCPLLDYQPMGGKIYANRLIHKLGEYERMHAAGLPVPRTVLLTPDLEIPISEWGEYVVVKPIAGARGEAIRLARTVDLAKRYAEFINLAGKPMLVQPYIAHTDNGRPCVYRVLTLFGRELYAARRYWQQPLGPLSEIASDPAGIIAHNTRSVPHVREIIYDDDILTLARAAHAAFPELPCLGVDIVRETGTGKLYVLEVNSGGWTWHLSSQRSETFPPEFLQGIRTQFNALERCADLLIEKTRAEAN